MTAGADPAPPAAVPPPLQPLLHNALVVLKAPTQAWSDELGDMGAQAVHGLYHSNTRVLDRLTLRVEGHTLEQLRASEGGASRTTFAMLLRGLRGERADPRFRIERARAVSAGKLTETITFESALPTSSGRLRPVVALHADFTPIHLVKDGQPRTEQVALSVRRDEHGDSVVRWADGPVGLEVAAPGATVVPTDAGVELRWDVEASGGRPVTVSWTATVDDAAAVVEAAEGAVEWSATSVPASDPRMRRWIERALGDLDALRLTLKGDDEQFLAAGAPWFFTLFGRDSIWSAEFLLPLAPRLALSTAQALAKLQGRDVDPVTAEQPGKIMHELRPTMLELPQQGIVLPPLYYGTIDSTPLWITLLHDVWKAGAPDAEIRALRPNLLAALDWMRDYGPGDDGFLRYIDETGSGLSNQGWKDSDDSIQWHDGRLAQGPIALSEVQGYAYRAALDGAALLDAFDEPGAAEWRAWAAELKRRFGERFWIDAPDGAYPAVALDARGEKVDSVASNMGHLLGTGILDDGQAALIARRLLSIEMNSGFGLRTMSTADAGYWPLSYHGGSVWAHDTAIAVRGLVKEGLRDEAHELADGLISAAVRFDFRIPELHSGDTRIGTETPMPYPAACRPQAWSSAAAVAIAFALNEA